MLLVQQWLVAGGVNGSRWHSGRSWHHEAVANQATIPAQFRLSENKYTVCVPDRLQLQHRKLIWSKLATLWSNLTGWIRHKYKAEVTGVCEASVISPQLKFTTLFPPTYSPFENKMKKYVLCSTFGVHHRSLAEANLGPWGEGQGSTYGIGIEGVCSGGTRPPSFCCWEDQHHQEDYLTSLITSSPPWGHYSFEWGRHHHRALPQDEWRDQDNPPSLLSLLWASFQPRGGWGNGWRSWRNSKKSTKAKLTDDTAL